MFRCDPGEGIGMRRCAIHDIAICNADAEGEPRGARHRAESFVWRGTMMMPRHGANRGSVGHRLGGLLAAALMLACLAAGAPASAKTITCGNSANPATQQKLKDAQAAQSYAAG